MRRPPRLAATRLALTALACATLAASAVTPARAADPRVPLHLPGGVANAPALTARVDARANNFSNMRLPSAPRVRFQGRVAPPIIGQLAADGSGRLLVAHSRDRLSAFDAGAHALWSVRLGAELASGPLLLPSGACLLVAREGRIFEVSRAGSVTEREPLPWGDIDGSVAFAPTSEGGALIGAGSRWARLGPAGTRSWQAKTPGPLRAVFDWRGASLAVGREGTLWARGSAGETRELGSFGDPVAQVMLVGDRLVALTAHELLELELATQKLSVRWADPTLDLRDMARGGDHTRIAAGRATLVELDADGHELARYALPTSESGSELAQVLSDGTGASFVTTSGAPVVLVTPQGDATSVAGTGCPDPLRLTPVADGELVAACRSGLFRALSDRAR